MRFEYDPAKSAANKAKHGIDFAEAQELWRDDKALLRPVTSHRGSEVHVHRPNRPEVLDRRHYGPRRQHADHFGAQGKRQ